MNNIGWKYYNHAAVPTTAPHESVNLNPIRSGDIWNLFGHSKPFFARWTENFDCGIETNWWYIIKDTPFDLSALKAKRRYEINKGLKNFDVRKIDKPSAFAERIYEIASDAYIDYPEAYRPKINREFICGIKMGMWDSYDVFGAFTKNENEEYLVAFARLKPCNQYFDFEAMKSERRYEKSGCNAALLYGVVTYYNPLLENGYYICDGARSVNHETAFQDYLEKYFQFRKAYCTLHILYDPKIKLIIGLLWLLRGVLKMMPDKGLIHNINSILQMEEIIRQANGSE